ncbi:MAG: hypothetical protein ACRC6E_10450 [Fusobacteriaceae bacterium]
MIEEEVAIENIPEVETTEVEIPETSIELDLQELNNLGSAEEIEEYLADVMGDSPSVETKKAINKLLAKLNKDSEEDEVEEVQPVNEEIKTKQKEVFDELPIPNKDFKALVSWVAKQPKAYQERISELTKYETNSVEDIQKAILSAHEDRLKSVGGTLNLSNTNGTFGKLTRDEVMDKVVNIHKTFKGQDRVNKINELKKEALSTSDLKDWATIYFN